MDCVEDAEAEMMPKERGMLRHHKIDWKELRDKLPIQHTPEQKALRKQIFSLFDPNGNRLLSLAEIDKGVRDILDLPLMFSSKPVMMRAYQAAKGKSKRKNNHPDFVQFCEFRVLLEYLGRYFELKVMFDRIDISDDNRISFEEWEQAIPSLAEWGVTIDDPAENFETIRQKMRPRFKVGLNGKILFRPFAHWAIKQQLELAEADSDYDSGEEGDETPF